MVPPYIGHTLSKVWVICVLVSQVFVFFGVFSTELLTLPCKITEVGRLSLFIEFFVGFHIVCDRYTLDNAHFTYFNTIWPLSLSSGFGSEVYPWPENLSYLGNGTSDHRNEKTKTLCNTKYPPKPRKTHLRNHFWPLESGFSAIATYKTYVFSKSCNVTILKFFWWHLTPFPYQKAWRKWWGILRHASVSCTYPCK